MGCCRHLEYIQRHPKKNPSRHCVAHDDDARETRVESENKRPHARSHTHTHIDTDTHTHTRTNLVPSRREQKKNRSARADKKKLKVICTYLNNFEWIYNSSRACATMGRHVTYTYVETYGVDGRVLEREHRAPGRFMFTMRFWSHSAKFFRGARVIAHSQTHTHTHRERKQLMRDAICGGEANSS